jgi:beta-carotene hydroxylase
MNSNHSVIETPIPPLRIIAPDLLQISMARVFISLTAPFAWIALYFTFAWLHVWPLGVACLICLSFVTYGSVSHDLVHGNLGLSPKTNIFLLSLIEALCLRSGHAYRQAHLHHHARFPHPDDIEGAAAGMSLTKTILEGIIFQPRIWCWAVRRSKKDRPAILLEGAIALTIALTSIALLPFSPIFFVYASLMICGTWVIPLATSYIPHDARAASALSQTRRFRGTVASVLAAGHLYHLEHHLYPAVPHHHWPALAKRLDPFLDQAGVKAVRW